MATVTNWLTSLLFMTLASVFSVCVNAANIEIVTVEAEGHGKTRDIAINEALRAAVARVNGLSVTSNTRTISGSSSLQTESSSQGVAVVAARVDAQGAGLAETRQYEEGETPPAAEVTDVSLATTARMQGVAVSATAMKSNQKTTFDASQKDISAKTGGQIKTYEILHTDQTPDGFVVKVLASIAKLKLSAETNRTRLAVVPFRVKITGLNAQEFERQFTQTLVNLLTQSRKFAVLDRDYINEQGVELDRLQAGEVPIDEMAKLGSKLATDFLLVGSINDVVSRKRTVVMKSTGKEIPMVDQGTQLSYRLIEAATGQVKFSDSYDNVKTSQGSSISIVSMAKKAGSAVAQNILLNFFPIIVEAVEGDTLVLGQGGNTLRQGQMFTLVQYGNEVFDSYTKESLGRTENNVGTVEVVEVHSKQSRARIVKSSIDMSSAFKPQEFIVRLLPTKSTSINKTEQINKVKSDASERIKKLKSVSDDDW